ncbi:MAG: calcium-binding protein [Xanthobacteraceae bacterium]
MAYYADATYQAVRDDPSSAVTIYNNNRTTFIADLGMSGLSEDAIIAAWCTMMAYGLAPYGPEPSTADLEELLAAPTLACDRYVTLAWRLIELFGISTDEHIAIGLDEGAVGNHAQMLFSDGTSNLLLDPTIGLVVNGVTLNGLISGASYTDLATFYHRNDITAFNSMVINAVQSGEYHVRDFIYYVPGLDNWVNHYGDHLGLTIDLGNGAQIVTGFITDDTIDGGVGNDFLYGNRGNDTVIGGVGVDYMEGNAGDDFLYGNHGNDTMIGGADVDHMEGNTGNDMFYVDNANDRCVELIGQGTDVVSASANYRLSAHIEKLILTGNAIYGTGNGQHNLVYGTDGRSILEGLAGNDKLYGRGGNDLLSGGNGNDVLDGGAGADTLYGLAGSDTFYYRSTTDLGTTSSGTDIVMDLGRGDRISLSKIDASAGMSGNQAFTFIGTDPFTGAGQVRWFTSAEETRILLNTDADSSFEALIRVDGLHAPSSNWFIL